MNIKYYKTSIHPLNLFPLYFQYDQQNFEWEGNILNLSIGSKILSRRLQETDL